MSSRELLAAYWTYAPCGGARPGGPQQHCDIEFRARVESLCAAGFKGLGLAYADLLRLEERHTFAELKRILDDHGMKYVELSVLLDWYSRPDEGPRITSDNQRRKFLEAAAALGAHHIKVSDTCRTPYPMNQIIEEFATLCREAADHGTRIAYELTPFSSIDSIQSALELVGGASAANGGVLFDLWHVVKLGMEFDRVWSFPSEYFMGVELSDGCLKTPPNVSLLEETMFHRRLCGTGEFKIREFLSYLPASGYSGPIGVETLCRDLWSWPLPDLLSAAYHTAMEQLPSNE